MRKTHLLSLLLPALMITLFSCKKESLTTLAPPAPGETIAVKIAPNEPYVLNLPDAGNLSISRQGAHFAVSEATVNAETGMPSYRYIPSTDFSGTDEISLTSSKTITNYSASTGTGACGGGSSASKTISTQFITVKITVGQ